MKTFDKAKWTRFALLVMGGGTIYKLANLKDVFYVPMQEHLGLSNTEIGMLLSVNSIVATALFVVGGYLADRFQTRHVIALGLVSAGAVGLYMSTFPGYNQLLVLFAMLAISSDCLFWPALLKSVRALGDSKEQGRMFGFLEGGRGVVDTLVAFSALGIFIAMGSGMGGFRAAIITYSLINIGIGVLLFFLLGKPAPVRAQESSDPAAAAKKPHVLDALKQIAKLPQLWLVSATVFMVYIVYVGLTYFIPYLSTVYGLPIALVGVFGIINQYGLKIAGGPLGGYLADKKVGSPSRYLSFAFFALIPVMAVILLMPAGEAFRIPVMALCLLFSLIVFTMRGVFWAPMDEVGIPEEISGTAFGVACLIGYAPGMFGFLIYGAILDANPGAAGFHLVFMIMGALALLGGGVAMVLARAAKRNKVLVDVPA
ncbi:MFS transporter [Arthrobacter sp. HLT1-20]